MIYKFHIIANCILMNTFFVLNLFILPYSFKKSKSVVIYISIGYSTLMIEQYNKYNLTYNVSVLDKYISFLLLSFFILTLRNRVIHQENYRFFMRIYDYIT